ncbi:MAG TPA: hypothetical protein VFN11_04725 [Ktedonobacterales bacterium]|nr:hypothetical protein [Ktedonobacterales bacterium]
MAARKSRKAAEQPHLVTAQADSSSESGDMLTPDELARALRAMASELERDPALARRVAGAMRIPNAGADRSGEAATADVATDRPVAPTRSSGSAFKPRLVTGAAPALGTGVPDPFALREQLGEDGLRAVLADLRLGTLRAIVREHQLDPARQLAGQNDDAKFRALILKATKRPKRG